LHNAFALTQHVDPLPLRAGAFFGFFGAIGVTLDGADLGVVHQPIDHRDDTSGVREDLAPFGEGAIGGDDGAFLLVAQLASNSLENAACAARDDCLP
jgi:hypothetical protein